MKILFCSEGFIIDGVASFNYYFSSALCKAGNEVAIAGRWMGFKGFQNKHKKYGVKIIQCPSITVSNFLMVMKASKFNPDVIVVDSRRSFGFAQQIKKKVPSAKIVTVFHDPAIKLEKKGRDIDSLALGSDIWITPEKIIYDELVQANKNLPVYLVQRPLAGFFERLPQPARNPFTVLCFGRLSGWKSPGIWALVNNAAELRQQIPSLNIIVVGGGSRMVKFWWAAQRINMRCGANVVRVVGPQTDPIKWFRSASVVCAGATSAAEAILCRRPTVAFSGYWIGLIGHHNIVHGIETHFGERSGDFLVKTNPGIICESLIDLYRNWSDKKMEEESESLHLRLLEEFSTDNIVNKFMEIVMK